MKRRPLNDIDRIKQSVDKMMDSLQRTIGRIMDLRYSLSPVDRSTEDKMKDDAALPLIASHVAEIQQQTSENNFRQTYFGHYFDQLFTFFKNNFTVSNSRTRFETLKLYWRFMTTGNKIKHAQNILDMDDYTYGQDLATELGILTIDDPICRLISSEEESRIEELDNYVKFYKQDPVKRNRIPEHSRPRFPQYFRAPFFHAKDPTNERLILSDALSRTSAKPSPTSSVQPLISRQYQPDRQPNSQPYQQSTSPPTTSTGEQPLSPQTSASQLGGRERKTRNKGTRRRKRSRRRPKNNPSHYNGENPRRVGIGTNKKATVQ